MNKFILQIITSILFVSFGAIELFFNKSINSLHGYYAVIIGSILLIYSIVSYIKYKRNRKEVDLELSKEFDERDELIQGKSSGLTLILTTFVLFITMLVANFITIPATNALFIVLLAGIIIQFLSRKYYERII